MNDMPPPRHGEFLHCRHLFSLCKRGHSMWLCQTVLHDMCVRACTVYTRTHISYTEESPASPEVR